MQLQDCVGTLRSAGVGDISYVVGSMFWPDGRFVIVLSNAKLLLQDVTPDDVLDGNEKGTGFFLRSAW